MKHSRPVQPLIVMILLLAACGLAGHFVVDGLSGAYILTEHECQERQAPGADVLADCCCTHPGFMLPLAAAGAGSFAFEFRFSVMEPRPVSASVRPLSPPPISSSSTIL
jgi:hypothetical protein